MAERARSRSSASPSSSIRVRSFNSTSARALTQPLNVEPENPEGKCHPRLQLYARSDATLRTLPLDVIIADSKRRQAVDCRRDEAVAEREPRRRGGGNRLRFDSP